MYPIMSECESSISEGLRVNNRFKKNATRIALQ